MTTTTDDLVLPTSAPKPRAKPPVRRRPPPAPRPNHQGEVQDVATMAEQLAAMQAKIERLEQGGLRMVESEPPRTANARVADPEELTDFQRELRAQTHDVPANYVRDPISYNWPQKWFSFPDGRITLLQGDPQNTEYYRKKGLHELTPDQVQRWLTVERPKLVKMQNAKAALITTIRRAVQVDPALAAGLDPSWEIDLGRMSIDELRAQVEEIAGTPAAGGQKRRMMKRLPRLQDADDRAADAEAARLMQGVETAPSRSAREAFESSLPNIPRRSRDIELTPSNARQFQ